jgi:Lar family restriction alleviation protein
MSDDLKSCPFCGGTDTIILSGPVEDDWCAVSCDGCYSRGPINYTDPACVKGWNTRTDLVQVKVEAAVKRALEGAAKEIIAMRGPVDVPRTDKAVVFDDACERCIEIIRAINPAQFIEGDKAHDYAEKWED